MVGQWGMLALFVLLLPLNVEYEWYLYLLFKLIVASPCWNSASKISHLFAVDLWVRSVFPCLICALPERIASVFVLLHSVICPLLCSQEFNNALDLDEGSMDLSRCFTIVSLFNGCCAPSRTCCLSLSSRFLVIILKVFAYGCGDDLPVMPFCGICI